VQGCRNELQGVKDTNKVNVYCNCAADAVSTKLSKEELQELDKKPDNEQIYGKVMDAIQDCIITFQQ